ncbi:HNH endonuclease [Salmonella enterica]|uniref:HNH endonuclease n=1 Tax=Salmonella enterica TaxID=28901 RepID=A0A5Y3BB48_SALER|nr:HNH endonuclease signature motif containing protein [Salmonella enterica]EAW1649790.1 HNH endonuclease [Salmonella enterica subsp. enterica]EDS4901601.1 HNH endonuclease [Salmonella enterica subsp. enterica serovar Mbandaka]EAN1302314.1 HNH endonuclease [Salmonella enterica]EAO5845276.1 HNH endonuclease [Salmonella enterica subsp. enterica serovar Cerro]EAP2423950.1 HNH endonuclease [Salmonella enterica]
MSSKYEDLIKNARINADCGEHMSPEEVTTLLNVVETTFAALADLFGDVKEIFGFKYRYFITSKGLIFSLASGELKQLNPTMRGKNRNQYLFVRLELGGKLKNMNIHRLVAENFLGPKPYDEHVINHKDGNKQNNEVSNLEWTTIAGNTQHAYRTGLAGGRKHGSYKGPVCAENEEGFGYVFFDSKQAIEAGFNPNSIRDAVVKPWKKVFGFYFSRINTEFQLRKGVQS